MSGFTYPVDYTGTAVSNRVPNELQLISSANYRNYKVIIPSFAPFYGDNTVTVVHQDSGATLVEGTDFYFTHLFAEATKSIGKPIYGSISIFNPNLAGTFVISYNTVGGEWTLAANQIASALGNITFGPRVARWEQIVSYPATFPPINHAHGEDDLTGMSDVVTALLAIQNAITTAFASGAMNFATATEAVQGILTGKAVSPGTLKVVNDALKALLQEQIDQGDAGVENVIESFTQDILGSSAFINNGYNVYKENGTWTLHAGTGYVEGKRIVQNSDQVLTGMSYPCDVWLDVYRNAQGVLQTNILYQPVQAITNLLRYSEEVNSSHWALTGSTSITQNVGYDAKGNKNISSITFSGGTMSQTELTESFSFGQTYLFSGYGRAISGESTLSANIGQTAQSIYWQLPKTSKRFSFPVVAGDRKALTLAILNNTGVIELGQMQVEPYSVNHNILLKGDNLANSAWTKTNSSISTGALDGPFATSRLLDKIVDTATNSNHEITQAVSLIAGQDYFFSAVCKAAEVATIRIALSNGGDSDGFYAVLNTRTTAGDVGSGTVQLLRGYSATAILNDVGVDTNYTLVTFRAVPKVTGSYNLTVRLNTTAYLGNGASGVYFGSAILMARGFTQNLLFSSNDFTQAFWVPNALDVVADSTGTNLLPTVLSAANDLTPDFHTLSQNVIRIRPGVAYTFFAEFKASAGSKIYMAMKSGTSSTNLTNSVEMLADITALTSNSYVTPLAGGWDSVSSSLVPVGGGWYRATITGVTSSTSTLGSISLGVANGITQANSVFNGDGVTGVLVRNAQLVQANVSPSYIDNPPFPLSKYVSTGYSAQTDYDGAVLLPSLQAGIRHVPVKIATLNSSLSVIDRRTSIRSYGNLLRDGLINNIYKSADFQANPNTRYNVATGVVAYIPPSDTLKQGDAFYFNKSIGTSFFLRVVDPGVDLLYFHDSLSNTTLSDIEILVDVDKQVTVLFDGSAFNVIY